MKNIIVIYHKNCKDGIASAWVAHKYFNDIAEFIAYDDWKVLPEYITNHADLKNTEVYIIDFSFEKETLLSLESKCKKLVVLDHHIGAKEAIESVKEHMYGTKDSGCMLAWKYFYPNEKIPLAIQYVSDSDTWTNEMPDYKYINSYVYRSDSELTIESFNNLFLELENTDKFQEIKKIGKYLRENYEENVNTYIKKAELINFDGYEVYAVNAPSEIRSELGHELAIKTNSFSVIYYYLDGKWKVSLRSIKDFDVSIIAKNHGGGGHKNAAAFTLSSENPIVSLLKIVNI